MSLSFKRDEIQNFGAFMGRHVTVTLDSSYPSNGYKIEPEDVGLGSLDHIIVMDSLIGNGYLAEWDGLYKKLVVHQVGSTNSMLGTAPSGTDLSGIEVNLLCLSNER